MMGTLAALRALYGRIGPDWARDGGAGRREMLEALVPVLDASARCDGVVREGTWSYGDDARQVLDVYRRPGDGALPVLIFMHGGGYVRGDKDITPRVYANVARWFAARGYLAVNMEYRLAPAAPYPAGAEDLAAAVAWIRHEAHRFRADPGRIFLVGHSAGGTHVAHFALAADFAGDARRHVLAAAILSGRLRADVLPANPNAEGVRAYFGDEADEHERRSPVNMVHAAAMPLFIAVAEHENPLLDCYGAEFFMRLRACGNRRSQFMSMPRHNHLSIVAHFGSGEDLLGGLLCDFFARHGGLPAAAGHG
ncbi:alpha/beta hydrolase [Pigmentiphaga sp.]|uniref:alpha/beta hydrolase n=1 Tax=Pigmentiphaga sp. TaxID=1977564 RepID=UPI0025E49E5E|nr:alpha/beta hydrolase [Pigmentiphaga sp.]